MTERKKQVKVVLRQNKYSPITAYEKPLPYASGDM